MSRKTITVDELLDRIAIASKAGPGRSDAQALFITSLCGTLEREYPVLAHAIARGAGMPHLYSDEAPK